MKVANAQGFWGDQSSAAERIVQQQPDLDYLTLDYLAEVSLSIMAIQRDKDPKLGYARDVVDVVRSLADAWKSGHGPKLITNAGGLNPTGCAHACLAALAEAGCTKLKVAVVAGDDVLPQIHSNPSATHWANGETGETELPDFVTANAYLGADPVREALELGADIVLTGRVADPSLVVGAAAYHYGWSKQDYNKLAGATIAGHLIECGTQVTGGISNDWLDYPHLATMGFPVVELAEDGSCIVTKPGDTGGAVNCSTVKEQLLYEIGDPSNYLSPDCTVSFLGLELKEVGSNRVEVKGALGSAPPASYKVSCTHRAGYRAEGMLTVFGQDAVHRARRAGEVIIERVGLAGYRLEESHVECLGAGDCVPGVDVGIDRKAVKEVVLRVAVMSHDRAAVEQFSKEVAPLVCSGPAGTTGYASGRPRVRPVFAYWPCTVPCSALKPTVEMVNAP